MSSSLKVLLICGFILAVVVLAQHGTLSFNPALPKDMPPDAHFITNGYNLEQNERKGWWVACHGDETPGTSFCRVTDTHGMVIYQGLFLPVDTGQQPESSERPHEKLHWATGPTEGTPIPVIQSGPGLILVPSVDRDALIDRWKANPDEWNRVLGR